MTKVSSPISKYIEAFPKNTRGLLASMRETILNIAPNAEEAIAYGMPTFKLAKKNLVHFAGYEHHIGFYPTPSGIAHFSKELSKYKTSKGAIQFPIDKPLPLALITKITKFRVAEVLEKKSKTKK
ncbi:MAG: hypothetical protein JWM20_775 [Patescibacteria group bacterium]|nr:hypothetical protein [Patescibacteria group bacterium]